MKSRTKMKRVINKSIVIATILLVLIIPSASAVVSDPSLKINIGSEVFNGYRYPTVTLENSVQKVVIRTQSGGIGTGGVESAIKDWILKSTGTDMVSSFVDANSFRGALSKAVITVNGENTKTVRLTYARGGINEYTINANSPVIKIKYEKYDAATTSNIVDILNIGGTTATRVYGQGRWLRPIGSSYYPCAYWDSYETSLGGCGIRYGPDPANAGNLNYKGNIIMAYGQTGNTGKGFGRVMPVYTGTNGGIRILKIFSYGGFEPYQALSRGQPTRPVHYGYIYSFQQGVDNAIIQGQRIVDGTYSPVAITVASPNGGENWARNTAHTISWTKTGSTGSYVKIELYKTGALNRVISSNTSNDGSYSWAVPSMQTVGADYKVKITSTSNSVYNDISNNYFRIS